MKTRIWVAACVMVAAGARVPASAQSLGDAARRAEQERAKAREPARVFTNSDVPDAPAPPPAASQPASSDSSGNSPPPPSSTSRRDERPRETDPTPIPASEGRIETRTIGSVYGDATETTLTLPLRRNDLNVTVTMVLRAVHEKRLPLQDAPIELNATFLVESLFLGKVSFERPHVVIATGESGTQIVFAGSVDEHAVLYNVAGLSLPLGLDTLSQLSASSKIITRIFSVVFPLSTDQGRLIGEFSQRVRRNPNRTGGL